MGVETYERERNDVVVLDLAMPGLSGLQILEVLMQRDPNITVVMLSGHGNISSAVEAMQIGADNFLAKPVDFAHFSAVLERAHDKACLRRRNEYFAGRQLDGADVASLGSSAAMRELSHQITLLAAGNAPILLTGETGTGKGWAAKLIHAASARKAAPFVSLNCAGLSSTFLDTELFGHEKGAFTDAKVQKSGLFEVANGGTLFLDEIGDLAPDVQPKLLTVLETQRFRRLGGTREIAVDVRLIAATHHDLKTAVAEGRFREDLYYRLAVLPLQLPPLRDRGAGDITDLALRIVATLDTGGAPAMLSADALALLTRYPWPGNIRELRNVLERAVLLAGPSRVVLPQHFPSELRAVAPLPEEALPDDLSLAESERRHIIRVMTLVDGNRAKAAKLLGIARQTLYTRLHEHGLEYMGRS